MKRDYIVKYTLKKHNSGFLRELRAYLNDKIGEDAYTFDPGGRVILNQKGRNK